MKMTLSSAVTTAAVALAGIVVPWIALPLIQTALTGSCEGFGCAGGLAFALPVSLVGGVVAALAAVLAYRWTLRGEVARRPPLWRVLIVSLLLAPLLRSVPRWPLPDYALPVAWFAVCALAYVLAMRVFAARA